MVGGVHCSGEVASRQDSHETEDDSTSKEEDTDAMLDYIERFNELMDNKVYSAAALHAANSPQGILRTTETFYRLAGSTLAVQAIV